jgi:hypothetical protein
MTNPANLPSLFCVQDVSFLTASTEYSLICHKIAPTGILNPYQTTHFKTSKVFLIYCPNCPKFSTIKSYAPNVNISLVSSVNLLIAEIGEIVSDKANQKAFCYNAYTLFVEMYAVNLQYYTSIFVLNLTLPVGLYQATRDVYSISDVLQRL